MCRSILEMHGPKEKQEKQVLVSPTPGVLVVAWSNLNIHTEFHTYTNRDENGAPIDRTRRDASFGYIYVTTWMLTCMAGDFKAKKCKLWPFFSPY
jgi:hypothetical protein